MAEIATGSSLHRLLRIRPGYAPAWFCARDSCTGIDLLMGVEVGLVFASLLLGKLGGWWLVPLALAAVARFAVAVHLPFESRERWGRARRRRGECVWCGQPGASPAVACP